MMGKIILWLRFRWLWLIPLGVSLLITGIWLNESFLYETGRMTTPISLKHPAIKDLQISIQYPTSISFDDLSKNAKSLTIFSQSDIGYALDSIFINFKAPLGVVTFLDKDRNRVSGLILLPIKRGSVPVSIWIEPVNITLSSLREVHIETSIIYSKSPDDENSRVPALDLYIKLEPRWRQMIRRAARSGLGTVAPLSLIGVLLVFSARTYLNHKRAQLKYLDVENFISSNRWDRAAATCREIIEIDPIYNDIRRLYGEAREKEEEQNKRLSDLYIQAKGLYASRNWSEARQLLQEIRAEKYDYNNEITDLLAEIEGKLNEAKELEMLYNRAASAVLADDLQGAIRDLRQIIAINPDYENAQAQLNKLEAFLKRRISSDPAFMRRLLAEPQIGLSYIATLLDASAEIISERLLRVTGDKDVTIRLHAAEIANQMKAPIAEAVLQNLMEDQDDQVRAIASQGLKQQETVSELVKKLSDSDSWREAGAKLIEIGEKAAQPLILALAERWPVWQRAAEILQAMRDSAQEELSAALRHDNPLIRERVSNIFRRERGESDFAPNPRL